jgi:hypothetical protein
VWPKTLGKQLNTKRFKADFKWSREKRKFKNYNQNQQTSDKINKGDLNCVSYNSQKWSKTKGIKMEDVFFLVTFNILSLEMIVVWHSSRSFKLSIFVHNGLFHMIFNFFTWKMNFNIVAITLVFFYCWMVTSYMALHRP